MAQLGLFLASIKPGLSTAQPQSKTAGYNLKRFERSVEYKFYVFLTALMLKPLAWFKCKSKRLEKFEYFQ